jgi:hypothetical protein
MGDSPMAVEHAIVERLRTLPPATQQEVLNFVEFLARRQPQPNHPTATTLLAAAGDLIGAIHDLPADLSTNSTYFQSFGQS